MKLCSLCDVVVKFFMAIFCVCELFFHRVSPPMESVGVPNNKNIFIQKQLLIIATMFVWQEPRIHFSLHFFVLQHGFLFSYVIFMVLMKGHLGSLFMTAIQTIFCIFSFLYSLSLFSESVCVYLQRKER